MVLSPGGGRAGASCPGRQEGEPSLPVCQCVLGGLRTPEATAEPRLSVVDPALGRPVHGALAGRWPSRCELPRAAGGGAEPAGLPVRAGRPADSGGHGGATLVRSRSGAGAVHEALAGRWPSRASCPGRQEGEPSLPVCQCLLGGLRTPEATAEPRLSVVDPALGRPVHGALAGRWPSRCELPRAAGGGAEPAGLPVRAGRPADSGGHGGATLVRSRSGAGEACSWCSRRAVAEPVRAAQGGRRGSRAGRSASACWEACGLRRPRRSHACP